MIKYFLICLISVQVLHAANWLFIQGTEKKAGHHPWGFIQVKNEHNYGDIVIKNGFNKTPFSYIKPDLQEQSEILLARLRVGLRGSFDNANSMNYFLLTEFAQNGVNAPLGYSTPTYITDASVTFKQLPIYLRIGKFKYAGSEEGHMARFTSPFINFSTVGNLMMLERFVKKPLDEPAQGVGAYRDTGLQLFNAISLDNSSEITLSYMLGNGSGTANKNINNNHFTHYGYLSYEKILGKGKGYKLESLKVYAWMQDGKRLLEDKLYDRDRYGIGATYFKDSLRLEGEYMIGRGMIFNGSKDINSDADINEWAYSMSPDAKNRADGFYLLATYRVLPNLELLTRYDEYNRLTNEKSAYRKFQTMTTGLSLVYNKYNRIDVNYAFNSIKAPYNTKAEELLKKSVGDLFSIQLTLLFK